MVAFACLAVPVSITIVAAIAIAAAIAVVTVPVVTIAIATTIATSFCESRFRSDRGLVYAKREGQNQQCRYYHSVS